MVATLQTLPPLAASYTRRQLADIDNALGDIAAQWRRVGPRFDTGWTLVGPQIAAIVKQTQRQLVQRADEYVPAVLEDTNQIRHSTPQVRPKSSALVGLTGDGYLIDESLATATIRAKQAINTGSTVPQALDLAGGWLAQSAVTVLSDTMRGAEGLGRYARNIGYVRMVHGGACGRCVVLAGRWYRSNAGFPRHTHCQCSSIPAQEDVAGDWQTNPDEYFHSLDDAQQVKLMGSKANAQAIHDGADIGQVVNAYRKTSGMSFAQVSPIKRSPSFRGGVDKFTAEGPTRRAVAPQQQVALRRNGPLQQRLMPESIYRNAASREDALRQLKLYGWISDDVARAEGRAIFAEQRRIERNARAVARRTEARA